MWIEDGLVEDFALNPKSGSLVVNPEGDPAPVSTPLLGSEEQLTKPWETTALTLYFSELQNPAVFFCKDI